MIDTHCHLNFKSFDKDIPDVVRRFQEKGGEYLVIPGAKIDSSFKAVKISAEYPPCFAAVGIHPHHCLEITNVPQLKTEITDLTHSKKVVAIGEIGLDYYQYKNNPPVENITKDLQRQLLLMQLDIALNLKLPVIFHCRSAWKDLLGILQNYLATHHLKGVFHCFSADEEELKKVLSLGFYVGFDGNVTYPENKKQLNLITKVPPDKLLLETDSPYLTALPYRGQRNEPAYLIKSAEIISKTLSQPLNILLKTTSTNAKSLFKFNLN